MADRLKRNCSWGRAAVLSECENKASATGYRNDFVSVAVIGYRYRRRRLGLREVRWVETDCVCVCYTGLIRLLSTSYDCVDRIALRTYFPMDQSSGGFLKWWNSLNADTVLSQEQLRRMAGDFTRRVRAF